MKMQFSLNSMFVSQGFIFFNLMAGNLNCNIFNYTINTLKRQLVLKSLIIFSSDKSIKKKHSYIKAWNRPSFSEEEIFTCI